MKIERYNARRRSGFQCGCLLLGVLALLPGLVGFLALTGGLIPLMFNLLGVQEVGQTDALLAAVTPPPSIVRTAAPAPRQATLSLGDYGVQTLYDDGASVTFDAGQDANGQDVMQVRLSESALMDLCVQRLPTCRTGDSRVRRIRLDLRPAGAIVRLDAYTGVYWQPVGVVLRLDAQDPRRVVVIGVDIDGVTYDADTLPLGLGAEISDLLRDLERESRAVLAAMTLNATGETLRLHALVVDNDALTIQMR